MTVATAGTVHGAVDRVLGIVVALGFVQPGCQVVLQFGMKKYIKSHRIDAYHKKVGVPGFRRRTASQDGEGKADCKNAD
jgi:hypothetical protein